MQVADFDYHLPESLIAQFPPDARGESRLLHVDGLTRQDSHFRELPQFLRAGDVLIFNDTKVIKARVFGKKESGGAIEALIERVLDEHSALAHIRSSKAPKPGARLIFADRWTATMTERKDDLFKLQFDGEESVLDILEQAGQLPLPPYITHIPDDEDAKRYQTIYARDPGAVAAPTAGLHFTEDLLAQLQAMGVKTGYLTLHVGAGTFQPVRVDNIAEHTMHHERYSIPAATVALIQDAKAQGGRVIAVGTTSLRALEAASQQGLLAEPEGDTNIFITPGYQFRVVDRLITNFHLPKSTLLMLVAAFAGYDTMRAAYQHAVEQEYRFFSYGDAMLLEPATLK
ncbi:tRNA preQ1(34) S-adenosylmethionine ribosyltransferase-isomerase QueA [Iodobacter fluviatilis]|uniref:S-adenosylmethionine:tRNA ribosyltransferase-isomerase n=1 Tax=Iodobacter fluviatilis TaxID=537 RepID=A0A377Q464_9NEIS|nr:tRNA preQ1(34) S-adenosylmethionine ribosyltransferase-isomerase QueA [Iodobacter fluviatilis]TCU90352.1 S-adenosylmethionine:tRNA ribosyltransferase-isomerase [Iodobacter fluviatilis]STQ89379.1 S-adenosylmethionine:tRNA ribosyltransferase-isomerase [Iodobacter fluviatilis]